jgi:hypothetical protein
MCFEFRLELITFVSIIQPYPYFWNLKGLSKLEQFVMLFNEHMVKTPFNLQLLKTTYVILHFIVQHLLRVSLQELYSFHTHRITTSPCLLQWWMSAQNNLCQVLGLQKRMFHCTCLWPPIHVFQNSKCHSLCAFTNQIFFELWHFTKHSHTLLITHAC